MENLYYYVTDVEYNDIKKLGKIPKPIFLCTSPKLKTYDFKYHSSGFLNLSELKLKKWVIAFSYNITKYYKSRPATDSTDILVWDEISFEEITGIAKLEYISNGLINYTWIYKKI